MAKREFLMLAHKYEPGKYLITGEYLSEKYDGMRVWWDGGISRGSLKSDVPWANTAKDHRYVEEQYSTGLWSRYGNVVHAPDFWLDALPRMPLDGELFSWDMSRQQLMSCVKALKPNHEAWGKVKLFAFDIPPYEEVLADGRINTINFKKTLTGCVGWGDYSNLSYCPPAQLTAQQAFFLLKKHANTSNVEVVEQKRIPLSGNAAREFVEKNLEDIIDRGGEGLMIRKAISFWTPERCHALLKYKPFDDDEGTVIGYMIAREGKIQGLMGSLILDYNGHTLHLSGFSDNERLLTNWDWCYQHPGEEAPEDVENPYFPRGAKVTFKYRGLTDDGIPQEARYWRKR